MGSSAEQLRLAQQAQKEGKDAVTVLRGRADLKPVKRSAPVGDPAKSAIKRNSGIGGLGSVLRRASDAMAGKK